MHYRKPLILLGACLIWLIPLKTKAATFTSGTTIQQNTTATDDTFLAGQSVTVSKPVEGELMILGSTIQISTEPNRSTFLAGKDITDTAGSGYDLFAVGQNLNLNGTYTHTVYLAGGTVTIAPSTVIHGDLYIAADSVTLAGHIDGSVHINSSTLSVQKAVIGHDLWYTADQPGTGISSQTASATHYTQTAPISNRPSDSTLLITLFATLLTAGLLRSIFPFQIGRTLDQVRSHFGSSYAWGILFLILGPIVIALGFGLLITYKLAIIALALYLLIVTIATNLGVLLIGEYILKHLLPAQQAHPWLQSLVGSLLFFLIAQLGPLGVVLGIILFPALVGAELLAMRTSPRA